MNDLAGTTRRQHSVRSGDWQDDRGDYIVLVADPLVGALDAYGPMSWAVAQTLAGRIRTELESSGLDAVVITIVALTGPQGAVPEATAAPER